MSLRDAFPDAEVETLTELQYSAERKGPFKLYIYEPNSEYHRDGVWFSEHPKYPEDGEITTREAFTRALNAAAYRQEVRVCNRGDMLVFHAKDSKVLYGAEFWREIGAES